ncbi:hypothetical protein M409DRAFT_28189 [Zasmidium cellare ATCC 36951]|uniref:Lipase n=1 Tax=Zasmidium cellare ATCC 36951 TaxID=1080233 RepID=A0A6A6C6S7_ZASCE|nr:uncharacterized protein M409DRAFT_28189 [Zasmidium cellare ATCC 36951]KAF2161459.1 hypothetical protein M409DRAFT_28189 [Zasmidium cellare ATCC 36951]
MLFLAESCLIFLLTSLTEAASLQPVPRQVSPGIPIPPRQDPWYTAPSDWEYRQPGEVLRIRRAPGNLTSVFNASEAFNILYRSTDTNYRPAWAVTTLFIPKTGNHSALLSYQIPYNTPDVDASPSYAFYAPPSTQGLVYTDITGALSRGWYVNVPDHEGPLASFACCVQEGHATLDSIRAVKNQFQGWSLSNNTRIALWGYSGGSIASEWAAELQVQYAPELKIDGAALGGLVPNLTAALPNLYDGSYFAALIPSALLGLATQQPFIRQYVDSELKPSGQYNATTFDSIRNMDILSAFNFFANQTMTNYFRSGIQFFSNPTFLDILARDSNMGEHGVPQMPLFVYKAIQDEITVVADSDAIVERYCQARVSILYERNTVGGHLAEETNGDARAFEWLAQVLSGMLEQSGCTVRNVSLNVTDSLL